VTTYFNFQPPALGAPVFEFQPTLDGQSYTASVPWLLFGQRWYLSLRALNGTLIFFRSLIGSPPGRALQTLSWQNGYVSATTTAPHGYAVGQQIELTISGCTPAALNGTFPCLVTGPNSFSYALAQDPGIATTLGLASYDVNLAWGFFQQSSLVFRTATQQFEVSP
jgi:hypothetical protein